MIIDFRQAKRIIEREDSPVFVVSKSKIRSAYHELQKALGERVKIHYAVKANPHNGILNILKELGSGFDAASYGEIHKLISIGVDATKIIFANPIKAPEDIIRAYNIGIDSFVYDNDAELQKLSRHAPEADVILRITTSNDSAYYKLSTKFGCEPNQAIRLLKKAKKMGLNPIGICFNAGSQNIGSKDFLEGIKTCRRLFSEAKKAGIKLTTLDIGGGYPVSYNHTIIDAKSILAEIRKALDRNFGKSIEIVAEPGRFICGPAAVLLTRVIGKSKRKGVIWYYLDDGAENSLIDIYVSKWKYDFISSRRGKKIHSVLAGPTCDSFDIISKREWLPELELGDIIMIPNAGAYTHSLGTRFNGFDLAKLVYID